MRPREALHPHTGFDTAPPSVRIAISDPLPVFRQGMLAILGSAGFECEAPGDLMAWARDRHRRAILMTIQSSDDWSLLTQLHSAWPEVAVVAILDVASVTNQVRALTQGAVSTVSRDAPPEILRETLEAAVRGTSIVPTEVLRVLTTGEEVASRRPDEPLGHEMEWLRALAAGSTVAELADRAGYSERAMFRLLKKLYARMNVKNRTEALMHAREHGWL